MTPSHAITSATELPDHLETLTAQLRDDIAQMQAQWSGLAAVGGQRDDHAAQLLQWMKPHLQEIARYATACNAQVEQMAADPFGRTDAA